MDKETETEPLELEPTVQKLVEQASDLFDDACQHKHLQGAKEYGDNTWMQNDTIGMLMEEVVDASNYARYTFIKLYLLQQFLNSELEEKGLFIQEMGPQSFKPSAGDWNPS